MRTWTRRWVLVVSGVGALGASSLGCYHRGCADDATCVPAIWATEDEESDDPQKKCPADPAEGPVADGCGVWVSQSLGDNTNPGTQASPVQTIAKAIALAKGGTMRVYICGETYEEPVDLPPGVSLAGGFDCQNGWRYDGPQRRAILAPIAGFSALTLLEADPESAEESFIGDIEARAADATVPGGSSIAVLAQFNAKAVLRRCEIIAGKGADGADGADGSYNNLPAPDGLPGKNGSNACTMASGLGGMAVTMQCFNGSSTGGKGGDGATFFAGNGGDGLPFPNANPQGFGKGGTGEGVAPGSPCTPGIAGAEGQSGEPGAGGIDLGKLTKAGYVGANGGDGGPGKPGQGGGGGGGSLGDVDACGLAPPGGAGGGSGGTGGCGGQAGRGGQAGGSSFGVASLSPYLSIHDSRITAGDAGNGGYGGTAQAGGAGGAPGIYGLGFGGLGGVHAGCFGGGGGAGGFGGEGGGGHGGHSAAVAWTDTEPTANDPTVIRLFGKPGEGGLGGSNGFMYTQGKDGSANPDVALDM